MSHLGRWLSAQVDGELDGVERDRVLNHLAGCDACRDEANALRVLKRRMIALGDSSADSAIAGRLIERARSRQDLIAGPASQAGRAPWSPLHSVTGFWPRQAWPSWRLATCSAGSALVAIGVLAFMLGGGGPADQPVPRVSPAVDVFWMQHSHDTGYYMGQSRADQSGVHQSSGAARRSPAVLFAPGTIFPAPATALMRLSSP